MINPATIDPLTLPSMALSDRHQLHGGHAISERTAKSVESNRITRLRRSKAVCSIA
jgi:hypothetical protein